MWPLTMYYNGLVISHKRSVNFLAENDGVVVGNFGYTWSQVSFVCVCVCVYCVRVCMLIKLSTLPYLTSSLALPYILPYHTSPYVLPYPTPYITLRLTLHHPTLNTCLFWLQCIWNSLLQGRHYWPRIWKVYQSIIIHSQRRQQILLSHVADYLVIFLKYLLEGCTCNTGYIEVVRPDR